MRAPSPRPTSRSFRYSPAHATAPGRPARSNVASIFETPPVEVMITTITTCGCSASTSMCRIVAVFSDGAETTASRLVTCESVSRGRAHRLLDLAADQRQLQSPARGREPLPGAEHAIDDVAVAGVGRHATGRDVGMREQAVLLEQRQFVAHGGRPAVELRVGGDRPRRHRLAGPQVVVHHLAQDPLLPGGEHGSDCRWRARRRRRCARLQIELGLGVADDLLARLLGDGVDHARARRRPRARCR